MVSAVVRATPKSCFQVTHKQSHASFAIEYVCVVSSRHAVQAVRHVGVGVMLQPGGGSPTSTNKSSCGVHCQNHPSEQSSRSCPTSDSKTSLQGRPSICLVPACHNQTLTPLYVKLMNCFRHETQASAQCAGSHEQIRLEGHPLAESAGGAGGSGCTEPGPEGHSPASWGCQHCESPPAAGLAMSVRLCCPMPPCLASQRAVLHIHAVLLPPLAACKHSQDMADMDVQQCIHGVSAAWSSPNGHARQGLSIVESLSILHCLSVSMVLCSCTPIDACPAKLATGGSHVAAHTCMH